MQVKGVIFDCDGTLLDSMGAWHSLEANLARRAGINLSSDEKDLLNGNTIQQTAEYFYQQYGLGDSPQEVASFMYDDLTKFYRESVEPRIGAVELVHELQRRGVRMTIVSSSTERFLRLGLARAGILECFDAIISTDDLGTSKRNPEAICEAQRIMGTSADATWGFEDSLYALKVLTSQGFSSVGIYDTDLAGTFEELEREADVAVYELDQIDIERFVAGGYRRCSEVSSKVSDFSMALA